DAHALFERVEQIALCREHLLRGRTQLDAVIPGRDHGRQLELGRLRSRRLARQQGNSERGVLQQVAAIHAASIYRLQSGSVCELQVGDGWPVATASVHATTSSILLSSTVSCVANVSVHSS